MLGKYATKPADESNTALVENGKQIEFLTSILSDKAPGIDREHAPLPDIQLTKIEGGGGGGGVRPPVGEDSNSMMVFVDEGAVGGGYNLLDAAAGAGARSAGGAPTTYAPRTNGQSQSDFQSDMAVHRARLSSSSGAAGPYGKAPTIHHDDIGTAFGSFGRTALPSHTGGILTHSPQKQIHGT